MLVIAIILFLLPIIFFINLHFIHVYYQASCLVFLLGALAISIGHFFPKFTGMLFVIPLFTIGIVASNLLTFSKSPLFSMVTSPSKENLPSIKLYNIGHFLRQHTDPNTGLVIFGSDWSSEIAFHSQRKTMTAPLWFKYYKNLWDHPQDYLGNVPLSAIVVCPSKDNFPSVNDIDKRLREEPNFILYNVDGCMILVKSF